MVSYSGGVHIFLFPLISSRDISVTVVREIFQTISYDFHCNKNRNGLYELRRDVQWGKNRIQDDDDYDDDATQAESTRGNLCEPSSAWAA